jgi:MbtH protein
MNSNDSKDDITVYNVVINHEEQYSIWPAHKPNPLGWTSVGRSGPKEECLKYIGEVWTDMRPLSLRKHMEAMKDIEKAAADPVSSSNM